MGQVLDQVKASFAGAKDVAGVPPELAERLAHAEALIDELREVLPPALREFLELAGREKG